MIKPSRIDQLKFKLLVSLFALSIRAFGVKKTIKMLTPPDKKQVPQERDTLDNVKIQVRTMKLAMQRPFLKGNCLSRSLALYWVLKHQGFTAEFHIGVKTQPRFRAHAWVEHKGIPLNAGKKVRSRYRSVQDFNLDKGIFQ